VEKTNCTLGRNRVSVASRTVRWVLISSPKQQVTIWEETVSSCTREGLDWMLGKISSLKGLSNTRTGYLGKWLGHNPWRYLRDMKMWCLGTRFSGGLGSVQLMIGLDDLKGLFQHKWFQDSIILLYLVLERLHMKDSVHFWTSQCKTGIGILQPV